MSTNNNNTECMITCWGIAAFAGVVAMAMLFWFADFGALQAIFTGGLIGIVLGLVLSLTVCSSQTAAEDLASEDKPAMRYAAQAAENNAARAQAAQATTSTTAGTAAGATTGAEAAGAVAAGSAAAASGAGTGAGTAAAASGASSAAVSSTAAGGASVAAGAAMAASKAPAKSAGAAKAKAPAKAATAAKAKAPAKAKAAAADGGAKAASADARPAALLDAPRADGPDDLKLISGVGPKLEQTLNDLGVYHFDQVAKFKKKDIAWVDARLRFKGRIERDDWMSQARILAKGGETEFSKGKKKT